MTYDINNYSNQIFNIVPCNTQNSGIEMNGSLLYTKSVTSYIAYDSRTFGKLSKSQIMGVVVEINN